MWWVGKGRDARGKDVEKKAGRDCEGWEKLGDRRETQCVVGVWRGISTQGRAGDSKKTLPWIVKSKRKK